MRVLVTGSAGHLGAAIVAEFARGHDVVPLTHRDLDIADTRAVEAAVARVRPDAVINCAVFNGVDLAEEQPVASFDVNALAIRALARAADAGNAIFVHFSSDFVFDGRSDRPYVEEDRPGPLSVYGASKLIGEWLAADARRWYVLRVESVFGGPAASDKGSVARIVQRIERGEPVPVFVDRTVSPSYAVDVARAVRTIVERGIEYGLYHCVNSGTCRWDEFARETAAILGRPVDLKPMTLETASLKALRPRYCALSNQKLAHAGIALRSWRDALEQYLRTRSEARNKKQN